jgi:hypothetical protein
MNWKEFKDWGNEIFKDDDVIFSIEVDYFRSETRHLKYKIETYEDNSRIVKIYVIGE